MNEIRDVYSRITNKIIADLEQGVCAWHQPWSAGQTGARITCPVRHNGVAYQGINTVALWCVATAKGYASPFWLTFRQAEQLGGNVMKGEHGDLSFMPTGCGGRVGRGILTLGLSRTVREPLGSHRSHLLGDR